MSASVQTRLAAIEACLAVIRGEKPPRVARQAFMVAAKDARILLGKSSRPVRPSLVQGTRSLP
ncbi:MAG: DUF982 domain-containing protein [Mesorhizobium sp.]|nr:MAG: DUF982 domain-containing protein [Mesorhizobium sp.]TIX60621.1 MAG: DUF982 domain-containing protein [Mesorhizobium sp.]